MKATPVPKHISATLLITEAADLIVTLRAAVREFENVPESIEGIIAALVEAHTGDLPEGIGEPLQEA